MIDPAVRPEVLAALRFLEARGSEPTTLADVADEVGYSRFHLAREFSATVGVAPMAYLAAQRFLCARRLLLDTDDKVVDICMAVGFSSLGTFTRRFTAEVGVTPTAFRTLPDVVSDAPAAVRHLPGPDSRGGRVEAVIQWPSDAPHLSWLYAGLFPVRAARGRPVAGSLLRPGDPLVFVDVPPGEHWLLASAFASQDAYAQLLPDDLVSGGAPGPLTVRRGVVTRASVRLARPHHWETPITVALPALTSPGDPAPHRPLVGLPAPSAGGRLTIGVGVLPAVGQSLETVGAVH